MTLTDLVLPTYTQMLGGLAGWLGKAESERGEAAGELLSARLAPDMFPLATQVRFACVQAYEGVARLAGKGFPPEVDALLDEGRKGGEAPGTFAQAQACIAQTLAMLDTVAAADCDPAMPVEHALPNGMIFDLDAGQYVRDWALPQFYFHVMTAYAILRSQGIGLGKADYVAHMFGYLRPGTLPGQ